MYLNYHNIENFKFPSSEEIFLQPISWNEYTGYDNYVSYGWWSPISSLKYFLGNLDIINTEDMGWIDSSINEDLKSLDNFSCKVIWTEDVSYFSENVMDSFSSFIEINNIRFNDVEFLIKFEYDKGDPSVGLWSGYNALLVLNNNLPIYRSIESVGLYEKEKIP